MEHRGNRGITRNRFRDPPTGEQAQGFGPAVEGLPSQGAAMSDGMNGPAASGREGGAAGPDAPDPDWRRVL